jgi:hypothetical protein
MAEGAVSRDQAKTAVFRASLAVQLLAAGFFGLAPLLAADAFATAFQVHGDEPYLFWLAGAATLGYAAAALIGLVRGSWWSLRIAIASTFTFNLAAAAACLVTIDESGVSPLPVLVSLAASAFAAISAFWLSRDEGPLPVDAAADPLEPGFRLTQALAPVAATAVGVWQLCLPRGFADVFNVSAADLVIIRLAGAATLGYGVAGLLSFLTNRWRAIRVQTLAAIVANVAAAIASTVYLAQGGRSILGALFLVAAVALVLSLTAWGARAERWTGYIEASATTFPTRRSCGPVRCGVTYSSNSDGPMTPAPAAASASLAQTMTTVASRSAVFTKENAWKPGSRRKASGNFWSTTSARSSTAMSSERWLMTTAATGGPFS